MFRLNGLTLPFPWSCAAGATTQKKGSSAKSCPFAVLSTRTRQVSCDCLRQVVAERRPHHVIHRVRLDTRRPRQSVAPRPAIPVEVGVLDPPLHSSLFALVELVPEAKGTFSDVPGITCARASASRCARGTRECLGRAARVVGIR